MVSKRSNTSNTWKLETTGNHWKPLETTASRMRKVYRLWGGDEISCGCMGRALQLKVMVLGGYRTWQGPWSLATWPPWHGPWRHDAMTSDSMDAKSSDKSFLLTTTWCSRRLQKIDAKLMQNYGEFWHWRFIWNSSDCSKDVLPWSWTSCQTYLASAAHSPGEKSKSFEKITDAKNTSCKAASLDAIQCASAPQCISPRLWHAFHILGPRAELRISRSNRRKSYQQFRNCVLPKTIHACRPRHTTVCEASMPNPQTARQFELPLERRFGPVASKAGPGFGPSLAESNGSMISVEYPYITWLNMNLCWLYTVLLWCYISY